MNTVNTGNPLTVETILAGINRQAAIRHRKGSGHVHFVLKVGIDHNKWRQGEKTSSQEIAAIIGPELAQQLFGGNGKKHSVTHNIGNILGPAGLRLRRAGKFYIIPLKLPVMSGDSILEEAVYD